MPPPSQGAAFAPGLQAGLIFAAAAFVTAAIITCYGIDRRVASPAGG